MTAGRDDGLIAQSCAKALHVSPFNAASGRYSFHLTPPGERLSWALRFRGCRGPVLKALFPRASGKICRTHAAAVVLGITGWMTFKVIGGIHFRR